MGLLKALKGFGLYRLHERIFGFFHGFGLATKLQDFALSKDGLVPNMLAFNVGVEVGQLLALAGILIVMGFWRRSSLFARQAFAANFCAKCRGKFASC